MGDTIILRDGTVVQGSFIGGSANTIMFNHQNQIKEIPLSAITTISISPRHTTDGTAVKTNVNAAPVPIVPPSAQSITIPKGTEIIVVTSSTVSTDFHGGGNTFPTVLHEDIIINEEVIIPQGTHIYGRVKDSEHASVFGKSKLVVDLNAIHTKKGTLAIVTDDLGYQGADETGETLKKTGTGAALGAIFSKDHAAGAAKGAAIGAALSLFTSGDDIKIPTGTILKFTLQKPVTIHQ